jgi:hypothetical protein
MSSCAFGTQATVPYHLKRRKFCVKCVPFKNQPRSLTALPLRTTLPRGNDFIVFVMKPRGTAMTHPHGRIQTMEEHLARAYAWNCIIALS